MDDDKIEKIENEQNVDCSSTVNQDFKIIIGKVALKYQLKKIELGFDQNRRNNFLFRTFWKFKQKQKF